MKSTIFRDVTPCNLVPASYYCWLLFHLLRSIFSDTSVNLYQAIRRHIPGDNTLLSHRSEKPKFNIDRKLLRLNIWVPYFTSRWKLKFFMSHVTKRKWRHQRAIWTTGTITMMIKWRRKIWWRIRRYFSKTKRNGAPDGGASRTQPLVSSDRISVAVSPPVITALVAAGACLSAWRMGPLGCAKSSAEGSHLQCT
jgi:hypothetical protein